MEYIKTIYNKTVKNKLIKILVTLRFTPNEVTVYNHVLTLTLGIWSFSRGDWFGYLFGVGIMCLNVILDYADGDLAKATGKVSQLGVWLDSVFDVIIQNAVMASIAVGCHKQGLPFYISAWFFVGNAGSNLVSFYYNNTFGFDSHNGSELFRKYMDSKKNIPNMFLKNLIDPTASAVGLFLYTARYWVLIGALFNVMPYVLIAITCLVNFRWILMYIIYAIHIQEYKKLWVNQALAILDKERKEHYDI